MFRPALDSSAWWQQPGTFVVSRIFQFRLSSPWYDLHIHDGPWKAKIKLLRYLCRMRISRFFSWSTLDPILDRPSGFSSFHTQIWHQVRSPFLIDIGRRGTIRSRAATSGFVFRIRSMTLYMRRGIASILIYRRLYKSMVWKDYRAYQYTKVLCPSYTRERGSEKNNCGRCLHHWRNLIKSRLIYNYSETKLLFDKIIAKPDSMSVYYRSFKYWIHSSYVRWERDRASHAW